MSWQAGFQQISRSDFYAHREHMHPDGTDNITQELADRELKIEKRRESSKLAVQPQGNPLQVCTLALATCKWVQAVHARMVHHRILLWVNYLMYVRLLRQLVAQEE